MGGFGDVDFGRPMWTDLGPDSVGNSEGDMNAEATLRPLLFVLLVVDLWRIFFWLSLLFSIRRRPPCIAFRPSPRRTPSRSAAVPIRALTSFGCFVRQEHGARLGGTFREESMARGGRVAASGRLLEVSRAPTRTEHALNKGPHGPSMQSIRHGGTAWAKRALQRMAAKAAPGTPRDGLGMFFITFP